MKNLKQLLIDRKYLEAKTLILDNREDLEESIDVMLEAIEELRIPKIGRSRKMFDELNSLSKGYENKSREFGDYLINLNPNEYEVTYPPLNIGQALYWNDEKKELECKVEDLDDCIDNDGSNEHEIKKRRNWEPLVSKETAQRIRAQLDKPSPLEEA